MAGENIIVYRLRGAEQGVPGAQRPEGVRCRWQDRTRVRSDRRAHSRRRPAHPGECRQRRARRDGERIADRNADRRPRRPGRRPAGLGRRRDDGRRVRSRPRRHVRRGADVLGQAIPTGSTAVIASVEESAVEVIDGEMTKLGGTVTRRPWPRSWPRSTRRGSRRRRRPRGAEGRAPEAEGRGQRQRLRARREGEGEAARRVATRARLPRSKPVALRGGGLRPFRGGDPHAEGLRPDRELERRRQLDRLAVDPGVEGSGAAHLEPRRRPRPAGAAAGARRVEDEDPEPAAVERRPRAGPCGRAKL